MTPHAPCHLYDPDDPTAGPRSQRCPHGAHAPVCIVCGDGYPCPILDANSDPVPGLDEAARTEELREWFAGRVPAAHCPHYIAASEARAGFTTCERCPADDDD